MYKQLYQYFNKNKLLCEQQYGFRSQHLTELAAEKLVDYIIKEMDCNKKSENSGSTVPGSIKSL